MDTNKIASDLLHHKDGSKMFADIVAKYLLGHLIQTKTGVVERAIILHLDDCLLSVRILATMHKENQKTERRNTQ